MCHLSLRPSAGLEYPRSVPISLSVLVAPAVGLLADEMQRILAGGSDATPAVAPWPREAT